MNSKNINLETLPIIKRVFSSTIASNLVSVTPLPFSGQIENEVRSINRDRKIDSIIDDKEFKEMKIEDHPDYKEKNPNGVLFYMDYVYNSPTFSSVKKY